MFLGKTKIVTAGRPSTPLENGHISSKTPNLLTPDEAKRTSQIGTDGFPGPHHYGKTLSVPDPNAVLHAVPTIAPPAPINPPRPAIMTTPKTAMISVKNPSTSIGLSPTETRPLLLVTTDNDQQQPHTVLVPNGRRLPLNSQTPAAAPSSMTAGRMSVPKNATAPPNTHHQLIRETNAEKLPSKRYNNRPRTALFFSSTSIQKT